MSNVFSNFFIFKQFFIQNRINRCHCWGPDGCSDTKISQIDLHHISMSYVSYDIKFHIMTNDAYDIEIWHKSIWSILVSKRLSGPQHLHLLFRFWIKNCLKVKKLKNVSKFFSLYKFWKSFVYSDIFWWKRGQGSWHLQLKSLMFLETVN